MFESNMMDNIATFNNSSVKLNNPWRELVTPQFKAFLDSLSTSKEEMTEKEEDNEL